MVYITRVERFNAAHKLWVDEWSEEQNVATFGKCSNKNWHGHNYYLHVTVKGRPHPVTGFIIDVKKLSLLIKAHVTDILDHSNLNLDVPFIPKGMQPPRILLSSSGNSWSRPSKQRAVNFMPSNSGKQRPSMPNITASNNHF